MAGRVVATTVLLLGTGCATPGAGGGSGNDGFVSGSGAVTTLAPADRRAAPAVAGPTLSGDRVRLADFAGQAVVVNVWGSWCAPCREEAPELAAAASRLDDERVAFLGIDTRDLGRAEARAFVRHFDLPYDSIYDPDGTVLLGFHDSLPAGAIPSTLVIDREGRVAARVLGAVSENTLVDLVRAVTGPA